jgi:hypothetical protein
MVSIRYAALAAMTLLLAAMPIAAQAPLPRVLVNAKRAYLASEGVDRKWLDRLATEFRKG